MGGGNPPSLNSRTLFAKYHRNLLFAIPKAFLTLLKHYKQFYLESRLKMCCYTLLNNAHKAQKYELRYKNRHKKICESKRAFRQSVRHYRAFDKIKPQSKAWVESSEFKAKYLDTNHPYPPLLNPDSIDYDSIPAEFAWELNLPLPPNYDLIYFSNGASASAYICQCFTHCGLKIYPHWIGIGKTDFKEKYTLNYDLILQKTNYFNIIIVCVFATHNNKLFWLLPKSVPLLYVARDPISRVKSACNHDAGIAIPTQSRRLNLSKTDFANLIPTTKYYTLNGVANKPQIQSAFDLNRLYHLACFDSFLSQMPNLGEKYIFSFESFAPNRSFETFQKIAKIFNLNMPQDERLFNTRAEKARFGLSVLPVEFSHDKITIHICADSSVRNNEIVELTETILGKSHYFINDSEIIIYTTKNNAKLLESSNDFARIKAYLVDYIKALENNVKATLQSLISEENILEYLRNDKQKREMLKSAFDNELGFLKANYPDIVESWKYYNEFEKMCNELDST